MSLKQTANIRFFLNRMKFFCRDVGQPIYHHNADTMQKAYDWCVEQGCNKQNIVVYRD